LKIAFGADHAGFELKRSLVSFVVDLGHEVEDLGTDSASSVDYPDFALAVAHAVGHGQADRGVLVCGTGQGMAMAANKVDRIRAAACSDSYSAGMARAHNDANILSLGARVVGPGLAKEILGTFLETDFEGGRHIRRLEKMPQRG